MHLFPWKVFIFFASVAAASAEADECEAQEPADREEKGSSIMQIGSRDFAVSEQLLENERARENIITESIVKRRQMQLAGFVQEGMSEADAVSLMRSFAGSIDENFLSDLDLSSDADLHTLFVEQMSAIHSLLCHVRQGTSDCESEYTQMMTDTYDSITEAATSLVQYVTGTRRKTKAKQLTEQGQTDPVLLSMLQDNVLKTMRYGVKLGENQDAMKHMVRTAMKQISDMDDASLLAYNDHTKSELVSEYHRLNMATMCLYTTASCSETLHDVIVEVTSLVSTAGVPIGTTLLQAGLSPVVQLLMKIFDLPEHPKETQAERSAAIQALLMEE